MRALAFCTSGILVGFLCAVLFTRKKTLDVRVKSIEGEELREQKEVRWG